MKNSTRLAKSALGRPQIKSRTDAVESAACFVAFKSALPDDYQIPSGVAPCRFIAVVALDVLRPFLHPERDVRLRHCRILAPMPVPETATHVDYCFRFRDYNVWLALKSLVAHSISPTQSKQSLAHKDLRQSVLAANLRHQPAALLCGHRIHTNQGIVPIFSKSPWPITGCMPPNQMLD